MFRCINRMCRLEWKNPNYKINRFFIMQQSKDLFGFDTQGDNYDIYRPTYPPEFRQKLLSSLEEQQRQNYLDLASGTGQLFFEYVDDFSGIKVASDLSEKQLGVAQAKIDKLGRSDCYTVRCNALELDSSIQEKLKQEVRFDVVTIGQALHWFDVNKLFTYLKAKVLKDANSVVSVQSYFAMEIYVDYNKLVIQGELEEISVEQRNEIENSVSIYESVFYSKVKSWFDCDRDNLSRCYEDYNFADSFSRKDFETINVFIPQTLDQFLRYLKTYSAYNTYVEKNPTEADPVQVLKDEILTRWQAIKDKYNLKSEFPPLSMKVMFFYINLRQ